MGWLRDWLTWWNPINFGPPPPAAKPANARQFILSSTDGEMWRAYQGKTAHGKLNGQACSYSYRKGVLTMTVEV